MPQVFFDPWIGPHYHSEGLWGRKVLVVGESHYNEWADDPSLPEVITKHLLTRTFTYECVKEIVDGKGGATFWTRVRNRLGGPEHESQPPATFWSKIAFYNFIQSAVDGRPQTGARPTQAQWLAAAEPLKETLGALRPDRVLFTGFRLWDHVPPRDGRLADLACGISYRSTGSCCPTTNAHTPRARHTLAARNSSVR